MKIKIVIEFPTVSMGEARRLQETMGNKIREMLMKLNPSHLTIENE